MTALAGGVLAHITDYPHEHYLEVEIALLKTDYPLDTCAVCDTRLGAAAVDYIHMQPAKSDRLVRLCSQDCVSQFKQAPAPYLAKIDRSAVAKKPSVVLAQATP